MDDDLKQLPSEARNALHHLADLDEQIELLRPLIGKRYWPLFATLQTAIRRLAAGVSLNP